MKQNKVLKRLLQALAILQVMVVQYYLENWGKYFAKAFDYHGVDKSKLFTLYNFVGIIKFFMPYVINEMSVWLLVLVFYRRSAFLKLYITLSITFLSATFILLITGFVTKIDWIVTFSTHFFHFGLGPSWPVIVLTAFYYFEKNKQVSGS